MNRIRVIFFDIDGTLVGFRHKVITDKTIEALKKLRDEGILLVIASGRPRNLIRNLKDFEFDGYITMNGTHVVMGEKVLMESPIRPESALNLARIADSRGIPGVAFSENEAVINYETDVTLGLNELLKIDRFPQEQLVRFAQTRPVYQYTVYVTPEQQAEYFPADPEGVVWHRWHPEMADAIPAHASKSVAVQAVIDYLGICREETISFGDGGNDRSMLETTGIGVAMGNANPEVKEIADYVTLDADEDGVVAALEYFGLVL